MIELCEINKCTGCEACSNICPESCISMQESNEGFYYPKINYSKCTSCGLCQRVCPEIYPLKTTNKKPKVYAAWNFDNTIRENSTSGGMFTAFATYIFKNNGVVYGVVLDSNQNVFHTAAKTKNELLAQTGSKYVQSSIGYVFREIKQNLSKNIPVLFSGTPCQVAGLKKFIGNKYTNLLFTVDLVCHGIPSPGLFKNYIQKLSEIYPTLKTFQFRDKKTWTPQQKIKTGNNWIYLKKHENVFFRLFWYGIIFRESCYSCRYTNTKRVGDCTLGDFWGVEKKVEFKQNSKKGISLLLVNSEKGESVLKQISTTVYMAPRTLEEAVLNNKQLKSPVKRNPKRDSIFNDIFDLSLKEADEKYVLLFFPKWKKVVKKLRKLIAG